MSTTYAIRVDESLKERASGVAEYYGFDLASATRALWAQMVRTHSIPLDCREEQPNEESLESLRQAKEMIASGVSPRFNTAKEMYDYILRDEEYADEDVC